MLPSTLDLSAPFEPELVAIFDALDRSSPPLAPKPAAAKLPLPQAKVNSTFHQTAKRIRQLDEEDEEVASITSRALKKTNDTMTRKQEVQRPATPLPFDGPPDHKN